MYLNNQKSKYDLFLEIDRRYDALAGTIVLEAESPTQAREVRIFLIL